MWSSLVDHWKPKIRVQEISEGWDECLKVIDGQYGF